MSAISGVGDAVTKIALGGRHGCYSTASGKLHCFGTNDMGQTGNDIAVPTGAARETVVGGFPVIDFDVGHEVSCARTVGGVFCWGNNTRGAIGIGSMSPRFVLTPTRIVQ